MRNAEDRDSNRENLEFAEFQSAIRSHSEPGCSVHLSMESREILLHLKHYAIAEMAGHKAPNPRDEVSGHSLRRPCP